jgi:hypothetical protein
MMTGATGTGDRGDGAGASLTGDGGAGAVEGAGSAGAGCGGCSGRSSGIDSATKLAVFPASIAVALGEVRRMLRSNAETSAVPITAAWPKTLACTGCR